MEIYEKNKISTNRQKFWDEICRERLAFRIIFDQMIPKIIQWSQNYKNRPFIEIIQVLNE